MSKVRSHTRTINGQRVHVTQHSRIGEAVKKATGKGKRGRGRKSSKKNNLGRRGWSNVKKAFKAGRRKAKWAALGFGVIALVEITAYLTLSGTGWALASVAAIAGITATVLVAAANAGGK